jgi:hypothetical protein
MHGDTTNILRNVDVKKTVVMVAEERYVNAEEKVRN